jgi:cysteine-rich repeat protein
MSTVTATSSSSSASTGPGPVCGDGNVDPGEACDDGNLIQGDGCNTDCVVSGTLLKSVTFAGADAGDDLGTAVTLDAMGNVLVAGGTTVMGQSMNFMIRKYDPSGTPLWTKTHDGLANDYDIANAVAVDSAGNVVAAGVARPTATTTNSFVRKDDSNGGTLWTAIGDMLFATGVVIDPGTGNVYVSGAKGCNGSMCDRAVYEYNGMTGAVITYISIGVDTNAYGITIDSTGKIITIGNNGGDAQVAYFSAALMPVGGATFGGTGMEQGFAISLFGTAYVFGGEKATAVGTVGWLGWSENGATPLWEATYGAIGTARTRGVRVDGDANVVACGESHPSGMPIEGWIRKYASNGGVLWTQTIPTGGARGVTTTPTDEIVAVGYQKNAAGDDDLWLNRYAP